MLLQSDGRGAYGVYGESQMKFFGSDSTKNDNSIQKRIIDKTPKHKTSHIEGDFGFETRGKTLARI